MGMFAGKTALLPRWIYANPLGDDRLLKVVSHNVIPILVALEELRRPVNLFCSVLLVNIPQTITKLANGNGLLPL